MRPDRDYHLKRVEQELDRARAATHGCARHAHLELAKLHAQAAIALRGDELIVSEVSRVRAAQRHRGSEVPGPRTSPISVVAFNDR